MSSREKEADGFFHIRFAYNGEQVTYKTADRKLVNAIDVADIVGLEFDKDGIIVGVLQLDDMPLEKVAWKFYVQSVGGKAIKTNSSETFEGMETMLTNNSAIIMDVVGKEGEPGCIGNPVEGDRIYAIKNLAGELTHVFIYERPTYMLYHEDYCEHCKETVKWGEWVRTDIMPTRSGHYQLQDNVQLKKQQSLSMDDQKICLDLNGKRVDGGNGWRIYALFNPGSSLALMDTSEEKTGILAAHGDGDQGMCVWVRYGQLHLYSGTLDGTDARSDLNGVAINVPKNAYFYMHGGEIIGGRAYPRRNAETGKYSNGLGGSMYVSGKFVMNGGVIRDGYAEAVTTTNKDGSTSITRGLGGNLFVGGSAELELNGGVIKNGRAGNLGGNIYMDGACTVTINGTRIEGGKTLGKDKSAGSIMIGSSKATLTMNSGAITGGTSYNTGGNIYCQGNFTMNGGTISGGKCYSYTTNELKADSNNYNVRIYNGKFVMNGGRIHGGVGFADSSTTDKYQATLILGGNAVIKSDEPNATNLFISTGGNPKIVVNKMGAKASIGVTTMRGVFTEPTAQQNATAFFSDVEGAEVLHTEKGLALGRYSCVCGNRTHTNGCDGTQHMWAPWVYKASLPVSEGNYFLTKDVTTTYAYWVAKKATVRLDLNGKNVTLDVPNHYGDGFRVYVADWLSTLVITDTTDKPGTLRTVMPTAEEAQATLAEKVANGEFTADEAKTKLNNQEKGNSGMIFWAYGGNVVMHNGILDNSHNTGSKAGMTVYASRRTYNEVEGIPTFTMYGGLNKGAETSSYGAAICGGKKSEINIHGGIVEGGRSTGSVGGNIYVGGKFYMDGGIVRNGYAASSGGNMYVESASDCAASAVITGTAQVLGGTTGDAEAQKDWGRAGNICLTGKGASLTVDGNAVISGGKAIRSGSNKGGNGGNIQANSNTIITMKGGTITSGSAAFSGGNIYTTGKLTMSGGKIQDGTAIRFGGNIYAYNGTEVTISGGTISGGKSNRGGNLVLEANAESATLTMTGGSIIGGETSKYGTTEGRGGSIWAYSNKSDAGKITFLLNGGTISGGKSIGPGGNIYIAGENKADSLTIDGATIEKGEAGTNGGNIYTVSVKNIVMKSGTIADGTAATNVGNLYLTSNSVMTMTGGTIKGGKAATDANANLSIYTGEATITGGTIEGGFLLRNASTAKLNLSGDVIIKGEAGKPSLTLGDSSSTTLSCVVNVGAMTEGAQVYITIPSGNKAFATATDECGDSWKTTILPDDSDKNVYRDGDTLTFKDPNAVITGNTITHCVCGADSFGGEHAPNCDEQAVVWYEWTNELAEDQNGSGKTASNSLPTVSGNYYLSAGVQLTDTYNLAKGVYLYLDLNGNYVKPADGKRTFNLGYSQSALVFTDSSVSGNGYIQGGVQSKSGGAILVNNADTSVTLFRGSIVGGSGTYGGNVYVCPGSFVMNGGAIVGGYGSTSGGNVYLEGQASFNLNGGTISGGSAAAGKQGGNIAIYGVDGKPAQFVMNGGSVGGEITVNGTEYKGGTANLGGNIRVGQYAILTVDNGTITGGTAVDNGNTKGEGGNIFIQNKSGNGVTINGGTISNGTAYYGGNISANSPLTITGGTITGGTANNASNANIQVYYNTTEITGGTIDGGVNFTNTATLKISGKPVVNAEDKTNILVKTGKVITVGALEDGAVIGVTLEDETAVFTGVVDEAVAQYFVSDNQNKTVAHTANGLALAAVAP